MDHLAQAQQLTTEFPTYTETCSNESLAQMALAHAVIALVERLDKLTEHDGTLLSIATYPRDFRV